MRAIVLLTLLALSSCTAFEAPSRAARGADEQALLALHENGLQAHRDGSVDALLANQAERFLSLNRGELSFPSKRERREFLGPYLANATFEIYQDAVQPVVKISRDGSLGWVAAQVEVRGTIASAHGARQPIAFVAAWIELYERQAGHWVAIGNASSFKGE